MAQQILFWAALFSLAAFAALAAAWWGRRRFVRGRLAVMAAGVFLFVGAAGGFLLREPVGAFFFQARLAEAETRSIEIFRTDGLLRALSQAEPERAGLLRVRLVQALARAGSDETPEVERRLRLEALRTSLGAAMARLPNASDEAAARLANALLAALKSLAETDALLCLGLVHPNTAGDDALTDNALERLDPSVRRDLEAALALTLASSVIRPHAAPLPQKTDAALADMLAEELPAFQKTYGGPKEVRALFEALADPEHARSVSPQTLCSFARDLLQALLRMPPDERGPGLRRLLGAG
jgi:hypothetical protein